ncbi:MAG: glycosyl hydrolase [Bacteroidota bacterium]
MIKINMSITPRALQSGLNKLFELSGSKILQVERTWDPGSGSPVFTREGKYVSRGWTEWTQGFQFGSALLQFDAMGDPAFLEMGKQNTLRYMAKHISHVGVHDHGFNIVSTYGNLLRMMNEGKIANNVWERRFYELAVKISGAIQARRWTHIKDGGGYIYSFNGPHSLFADTIRSLRVVGMSHRLGHVLLEENDREVNLLGRLIEHARATARYSVYYGEGRDAFDIRGRVAHESIFNDGSYRCPNSQQGYSPFTTWTRGLAWIMCGIAEQLEFLDTLSDAEYQPFGGKTQILEMMRKAAQATSDFYIEFTPADGIPYWDTGAPLLHRLGDYLSRPADPFNDYEPVDSSAAAVAAQGLLRLGHYLRTTGDEKNGNRYWQSGLTVLESLLLPPYLNENENHEGLILHSVYHRPNGWDHIPKGHKIPCGESSMWGDYHAREVALYLQRIINDEPYLVFWKSLNGNI